MPSTLRQKQGRLRQYSMDYFNENAQLADVLESMVPSYVEDAMAKAVSQQKRSTQRLSGEAQLADVLQLMTTAHSEHAVTRTEAERYKDLPSSSATCYAGYCTEFLDHSMIFLRVAEVPSC